MQIYVTFKPEDTKHIIINGKSISIKFLKEKKTIAMKKAKEIVAHKLASDEKYFFNFIKDELVLLVKNHISTQEIQQWILNIYDVNISENILEQHLISFEKHNCKILHQLF